MASGGDNEEIVWVGEMREMVKRDGRWIGPFMA
jgi:hypothetical protein